MLPRQQQSHSWYSYPVLSQGRFHGGEIRLFGRIPSSDRIHRDYSRVTLRCEKPTCFDEIIELVRRLVIDLLRASRYLE